ncbi:MAG TPA: tetratricopeptide repeat protein [Candidatus Paceibacterota bacterium]|nr:tetratricopeptide repeat protein [Candidatus Paceibacterota bacterium]
MPGPDHSKRLKGAPPLLLLLALALGVVAGGCARGWRSSKTPRPHPARGTEAIPPASTPAEPEEFKKRVDAHAHFAAGIVHDVRGETAQALDQFALAATADPSNEQLVMELAHRWLQQQQAARAVELLSRSAARPEASGLVYGWLGMALAQEGKTNSALSAFRSAVRKDPESLMGYQGLAQAHLNARQVPEALKVLDEAARRTNASPALLVGLAEFVALAGRSKSIPSDEARTRVLKWLEQAARSAPAQALVLQRMAETYKAVGELSRAAALYEELLERHSGSNPAFGQLLREQLVRLYLAEGNKEKAAVQLKAILHDTPTAPKAHLLLGAIAAEDKRYAEAADAYAKAILLDADLEPAYYELAAMRLVLGEPDEALATLTQARTRFGANFLVDFYSGLALAGRKEYTEALKHYTSAEIQARASEPSRLNHIFYFQLGSVYERMANAAFAQSRNEEGERHFAEAEKNLRRSLELSADNAEVLNYLGYMWAERGMNLEEARRMIEKAVALEPESAAILDSLAWVLFQLKQPQAALEPMLKAIQLSPKPDATLFDHLGDIYNALGRVTEAREAWRKSLDVEPNDSVRSKLGAEP